MWLSGLLALVLGAVILPTAVGTDAPAVAELWNVTASMGRAIYISGLHVRKAKCGRRIPTGNYRLQVMMERDHFRGNTATRGWAVTSPAPAMEWPASLMMDLHREDQARCTLRWTLEARNGSWATWERLYRSEVTLAQLLEEDSAQHCMIMFPKVLPASRTYRKEPCDHVLCMTVHHAGTEVYPPESWVHTAPFEGVVTATLVGMFVLWIVSGWIARPLYKKLFYLTYLAPLGLLGVVVWYRVQGLQTVEQGKVLLHDLQWGYGAGLSYGTAADQEYHFEATLEFASHTVPITGSTVTGLAVSRNPDQILWPEVWSWPVPAEPTAAHTAFTLRAKVYADGQLVEAEYVLPIDAANKPDDPLVCVSASQAPQPQFCLKYGLVPPQAGPTVGLLERLPGFGLMGYGAIAFVIFVVLRKRKVPTDEAEELEEEDKPEKPSFKKRK
eukprot:EG_transcript_9848